MKSAEQRLNDLFVKARSEIPFGEPRDYGFEPRLRKSIGENTYGSIDCFNTLCWRISLASLPVIVPAIVAIMLINGQQIPDGVGAIVGYFNLDTIPVFQ